MKKIIFLVAALFFARSALATVYPDNNLHRSDDVNRVTEVTRAVFENTMKRVEKVYSPIVAKLGGRLSIVGDWSDSDVNGEASREGNNWIVTMGGGLARISGMKPDFFLFQVCHELSHHVAGFPFYDGIDWVSAESEADYYTTRICLKKILAEEKDENARVAAQANALIIKKCSESWASISDRNLCVRVVTIGEGYARLYALIRGWYKPAVDSPEDFVVNETFFSHAKAQVKLDVYFAGALCTAPWNDLKIPGYRREENQRNSIEAEREAAAVSCHQGSGYAVGLRPVSYFLPRFDFLPMQLKGFRPISVPSPGTTFRIGATVTNAAATMSSGITTFVESLTTGVNIVSGSANVGDIAPGVTGQMAHPFEIKLDSDFQCGAPFELKMTATSTNAGNSSVKKEFVTGRFESSLGGTNTTTVLIPVYGDVSSPIKVTETQPIRRVRVKANIVHQYARDMKIFIIAPNGEMRFLSSPAPEEDDIIVIDKEVDLPVSNPAGEWQLYIVDDMEASKGELKNWELYFKKSTCN